MDEKVSIKALVGPTPKQETFLAALFNPVWKYLLYGGAKGGGKSRILRWALVCFLIYWGARGFKNMRVGLFCEDYPSLKDRQLTKMATEFPAWLGTLADTRIEGLSFILKPEWGGGIIALRNLDDPSKFASSEFAAMAVDELTKNSFEVFQQLRSILRWPGFEDVKFIAGTNPGGAGHLWVKDLWIKRKFSEDEKEAHRFYFLQAFASDNPHNAETYLLQLQSLKPSLRRAYLEGDWDLFEGQFFEQFRRDIHLAKGLERRWQWANMATQAGAYPLTIGIDYGNVTVGEVIANDIEASQKHVINEWIEINKSKTEKAESFAWFCKKNGYHLNMRARGDVDMFIRRKEMPQDKSPAFAFREAFKRICGVELLLLPVSKVSPDRNKGYRIWCNEEIDDMLVWEQDESGLWIKEPGLLIDADKCPLLAENLPALIHDPHLFEDIFKDPKNDLTHPYDALKYGLLSPTASVKATPQQIAAKRKAIQKRVMESVV